MLNLPESFEGYYVLGILVLLFIVTYKEYVKASVAFFIATLLLVIPGIITVKEVLNGLSNQAIVSIVMIILITAGLRTHYDIESVLDKIFGRTQNYRVFLAGMMAKVAVLSSFVNNTPVVVLMTPYVFNWGRKRGIAPSKLLIPLSYATIVGGMITIIGTSTTLVLNGLLIIEGLPLIQSVDLLITGSAVAIGVIIFLTIFSDYLLPKNKDVIENFEANQREYLIEKRLSDDSDLIGKTVANGGLRNLQGVYLVEIVRDDETITPVSRSEVIQKGDVLIFAGSTEKIVDLSLSNIGLELPKKLTQFPDSHIEIVESVISANSSLITRTIKESNFRERYDAAVVAVHRNGERLSGKIGRIKLKAGDVLLMYVGSSFENRVDLYKDMYVISGEKRRIQDKDRSSKVKLFVVILTALFLLFTGFFSLLLSLAIIFALMVIMKLITIRNIKRDIDVNMVVILVLSLALGEAMINSGAGEIVVNAAFNALPTNHPLALLIMLMLITTVLTSFITNVGAVAISFPLALAISAHEGLSSEPFILALAFSASAAFLTPVSYQTNLIIFGPGGYSFKDFFKIGLPTTVVYLGLVLLMIYLRYGDQLML